VGEGDKTPDTALLTQAKGIVKLFLEMLRENQGVKL